MTEPLGFGPVIIAAVAANGVIGRGLHIPWKAPEDLAYFKRTTTGHTLVMGRRTFESLGKPLPNRTTIVVTRDPKWQAAGCLLAGSLEQAIKLAPLDKTCFICGGAAIYREALTLCDTLLLTELNLGFIGDVFFPEFDRSMYIRRELETVDCATDPKLTMTFVRYVRVPAAA